MKGGRGIESIIPVVQTDCLGQRQDSPFISWVGALSLVSSFALGGEVYDLLTRLVDMMDDLASLSFFFISPFSLWRAWISNSFLLFASSLRFFISAISLCRDSSNIVWSASIILSLAILRVDTIHQSFFTVSLDPMVGANCSRSRMGHRELLRGLVFFFPLGRSCYSSTSFLARSSHFLPSLGSWSSREHRMGGTCRRQTLRST